MTLAGAELDISLKGLLGAITHEPTLIMYANSQNTSKLIEFCKLALDVGHLAPADVTEVSACLAARRSAVIAGTPSCTPSTGLPSPVSASRR
ncbi:hypothetical protein [Streptomyces sp. NBC_00996]|uniref:hypothetical protein n=1 Tax=Streptomyces sp. NBC_00996 TaxID=2903710 RepID=UPI00386BC674|nr:hypothetical protein OG390_15415 [Streptomyces sp. NBC_00996]